ncbi:Baculoviral IAP repeat-containing 6, putative [Babesia ovata]|uniref:Baculoviral IAP repeat-containing 6, putative n=1 Tax=Babesia ovata TaxID=189622 RepID=A0A2H6KCG3_9APIC|nr:Baculoviral IAP repeat-containing 6, putative [Babesia ovata]GBE60681.1 Baculoviral IAP repeat-containing 6, putative [Babesia ovata]
MERAVQPVGLPHEDGFGFLGFYALFHHDDDQTMLIQPTSACTPGHLYVLARCDEPVRLTIPLVEAGEHHASCRHVDTHGERFSAEEHLDEPFLEEDFYYLLYNR